MSITVIRGSFGGYDEWCEPIPGVDNVLVTDQEVVVDDWTNTHLVTPGPHNWHPRMVAKLPKCRPDIFAEDDTLVWLDASARVKSPNNFVEVVEAVPLWEPIAQFKHPDRDCILDEAIVSETMPKYDGQPAEMQALNYGTQGMPRHYGLWATGMIVYHPGAFELEAFGNAWLFEQMLWSYQDQISEPYLLWKKSWRPFHLPGHLRSNDYVEWLPHRRND